MNIGEVKVVGPLHMHPYGNGPYHQERNSKCVCQSGLKAKRCCLLWKEKLISDWEKLLVSPTSTPSGRIPSV